MIVWRESDRLRTIHVRSRGEDAARFLQVTMNTGCAHVKSQHGGPPVAVAQAMFKREHRRQIAEAAPGIVFVHCACDELMRCARLARRKDGIDAALGERMSRGSTRKSKIDGPRRRRGHDVDCRRNRRVRTVDRCPELAADDPRRRREPAKTSETSRRSGRELFGRESTRLSG